MLDKPTYKALSNFAPLGETLVAGYPELHWSCPRRYSPNDGTKALQKLNARVTVLDLDGPCHIRQDLNTTWDWRIGKYDTILDIGTIEHVADIYTCLSEYIRHLNLNGKLVISTVHNQLPEHGYHQPTPRFFWDFLHENGFQDVAITSYSPFFFRPYKWTPAPTQSWTMHAGPRLQLITAVKTDEVTNIKPPQQRHWSPYPIKAASPLRRLIRRILRQLISEK